ncbi:hypothetical protein BEWA_023480 [Theileria equi strain WA]|uniref:Uncharacterized protein n=1 Tax=Theileria equi strain WA TaxID=1537102 RepID=L0AX83_THEEQ|nr:hypothetical protein BEWA_023480 [Theileria equi strain WA]AFZ79499.1 hypothetical protein BEWA_023480 [Theileria equi strain WA]|eukprot:XP_004829165.1 hypothetical protein BEWA_023480 [Theileria equi strain WA]
MTVDQQGVIIQLRQKSPNGGDTSYRDSTSGKQITVKRTPFPNPPGKYSTQDFYKYKHSLKTGGQTFNLKAIQDDTDVVISVKRVKDVSNVESVSAYYWKHEVGPGRKPTKVFIVGVTTTGNPTAYYTKSGYNPQWYLVSPSKLDSEILEAKLDGLNCSLNNTATINLTKDAYTAGKRYCCHKHSGQGKITVTPVPIFCKENKNKSHTTAYKHEINTGDFQLADIEYYLNGIPSRRKKINIPNLNLPTKRPVNVTVYAFYSKDSTDPKLIYVDSDGEPNVKGWYKNNGSKDNNEEWINFSDISENTTPESITNCKDNNWSRLVNELQKEESTGLKECNQATPIPSPETDALPIPPLPYEVVVENRNILPTSPVPGATPMTTDQFTIPSSTIEALINALSQSKTAVPPELSTTTIVGSSVGSGIGGTGLGGLGAWVWYKYFFDPVVRLI